MRETTTDFPTTKKAIKEYHKLVYVKKISNLRKVEKFFERHKLQKITQVEIDDLNEPMSM